METQTGLSKHSKPNENSNQTLALQQQQPTLRGLALTGNGSLVPGGIVQYVTTVSLPAAIEHGEQISRLNRESPLQALTLVAELVKNLCNFFKTKRALEGDDFFEVAGLIIEGHKLLKVEEIAYAFKLAKLGKLSKVKIMDRLDGGTILAIVDEYDRSEERAAYFEKRNAQHKAPTAEKFEALSFLTDNAEKIGIDISKIGSEKEDKEDEYRKVRQEWLQSNPEKRRE